MSKKAIYMEDAIAALRKEMNADKDIMSALLCGGVEAVLKRLPAAWPAWVPAVEDKPKDAFLCFVTVNNTNSRGEDWPDILPYFVAYDRESETWVDYDGEQCPFEVVAWMPLPKPYRG